MYLETDVLLKVQNPNSWKDKLPFPPGFFLSLNKERSMQGCDVVLAGL